MGSATGLGPPTGVGHRKKTLTLLEKSNYLIQFIEQLKLNKINYAGLDSIFVGMQKLKQW